jgi:hypothetical protein
MDDTPEAEPVRLPGYEPGFKDGYRIGMDRALWCLREAMIEDRTDPGEAYLITEKLRRWIAAHGG